MEVQKIPISLVHPSPMNPRKTFDEDALQELADNIERQGLLQPITVRPIKSDNPLAGSEAKFEIICGERRFRAVSKLSDKWREMDVVAPNGQSYDRFSEILAIVRDMTDEEAFDAMITENLQRQDVDPIEEAFAFNQLQKTGKTIEEIALRFGKSVRFIQDRLKLNTLIPELMLSVRDGVCPIAAAMIICKLDESEQQSYYNQHATIDNGFTKQSAENFIDNLFMNIDKSPWYQSDDQSDEDFTGSCNVKCSECSLNTANHGCLFWEMKSQDNGRCTNRTLFQNKTLDFIMHELDRRSDRMVRAGEPLEYGKIVVAIKTESYESGETIELKERLRQRVIAAGYEIVEPSKVFSSQCYYSSGDERLEKMLKSGEVYRVLSLFSYTTPGVFEKFWHVKKNDTTVTKDGKPSKVYDLVNQLHVEQSGAKSSESVAMVKAIHEHAKVTNGALTELERKWIVALLIKIAPLLYTKIQLTNFNNRKADYEYIASHPEAFDEVLRAWMQQQLYPKNDPVIYQAEPILPELCDLWCAEEAQKEVEKVKAKHEKKCAKIIKQLAALGYDAEGNLLPRE